MQLGISTLLATHSGCFARGTLPKSRFPSSAPSVLRATTQPRRAARKALQPRAAVGVMTVTAAAGNPAPLLGGILIGLASSFKLATTGRVAGISGIVGGLVRGSFDTWRVAFVSGLLAGGALLTQLLPAALAGAIPATLTTTRALTAGLLVGLGTSLGSGCTSGHGVCGLARLSLRSLAAVMTFMATGAVTATVFDTAALVGATTSPVWPTPTTLLALSDPVVLQVGGVAAAALGGLAALLWLVRDAIPSTVRADVAEFASGLVFAIGLGISGMLQPAKVAAFLTPLGKAFDPSLMGVMGGALLVTTPSFQLMTRLKKVLKISCFSGFR